MSRVSFEEYKAPDTQRNGRDENGRPPEDYFSTDGSEDGPTLSPIARNASLSIRIPPSRSATDMAFTALQYLPMPILVLSSDKRIVLANEAMGRLFGIGVGLDGEKLGDGEKMGEEDNAFLPSASPTARSATDILYGTALAELGLDLLQGGSAVFVAWEDFLNSVLHDASRAQSSETQLNAFHRPAIDDSTTPVSASGHHRSTSTASSFRPGTRTEVHDAVAEVVFSTSRDPQSGLPLASRTDVSNHIQAQLIM